MEKDSTKQDITKDITSGSQVNSHFPYRWLPASLTLNIYYYLFLYLKRIIRINHNHTSHLKPPNNQIRRAALGRPAIKLLEDAGGRGKALELVCGPPTIALDSSLVHQTKQPQITKAKGIKHKQKAKRAADIEGQVTTMLESYTRQLDTIETTTIKRTRKKMKKKKKKKKK